MKPIATNIISCGNIVYIGFTSPTSVKVHLCTERNSHLGGYYLFTITINGYKGDGGIGGYDEIDKELDQSKLSIIGVDEL